MLNHSLDCKKNPDSQIETSVKETFIYLQVSLESFTYIIYELEDNWKLYEDRKYKSRFYVFDVEKSIIMTAVF